MKTDNNRLIHLAKVYLAVLWVPYLDECTAYIHKHAWLQPAPTRPVTFAQFVYQQAPDINIRPLAPDDDLTAWSRIAMELAAGSTQEAERILASDDKKHLSSDIELHIEIAFDSGSEWPTEYIVDGDGVRVGLLYEYPEFVGLDAYNNEQWANPANWKPGPLAITLTRNKHHTHRRGLHHDTYG